jgi:hypothetical protein
MQPPGNSWGATIEPGCGLTDLNDVLPNVMTLEMVGAANIGGSSSTAGNFVVNWEGQRWYMSQSGSFTPTQVDPYTYSGPSAPQGPCGDLANPDGGAGTFTYNWGPGCQCEGQIVRTGNNVSFFSSASTIGAEVRVPFPVP